MNRQLLTKVNIKADAQGNAPSRIELLRTGEWEAPWHGNFEITTSDLHEFAANFASGTGLVAADPRAPINYAHESWNKAAAWIPRLIVSEDGQALLADGVEWTPAAQQALKDGEWKYISPEFNPRGCPWEDAEGSSDGEIHFVNNVLTGAALTNIPLFKKLKPIMASRRADLKTQLAADATGQGDKNNKEGAKMDLETIRSMDPDDVSAEEKQILVDNIDQLTDAEVKKFGLEADDKKEDAADGGADDKKEAAAKKSKPAATKPAVEASTAIKGITDEELAQLRADATAGREAQQKLAQKEATDFIAASVKAGQIKSGEADRSVKLLLASSGTQRADLEAFIKALPINASIGVELGDAGDETTGAADELHTKVVADIKAAADKGTVLPYAAARKAILTADAALAQRIKKESEDK